MAKKWQNGKKLAKWQKNGKIFRNWQKNGKMAKKWQNFLYLIKYKIIKKRKIFIKNLIN